MAPLESLNRKLGKARAAVALYALADFSFKAFVLAIWFELTSPRAATGAHLAVAVALSAIVTAPALAGLLRLVRRVEAPLAAEIERVAHDVDEQQIAVDALTTLNATLESRVHARTAELGARNQEVRRLLEHVDQAVFVIESSGTIARERSGALTRWFGVVDSQDPFHRVFGRHDASFGAQAELAWEQLHEGNLPREVALDQMPRELESDGRRYQFAYRMIEDRVLVIVSDVTLSHEKDELERDHREMAAMFEHVLGDRIAFAQFLDETSALIEKIRRARLDDLDLMRRWLTAVRETAPLYGIRSVAEHCEALLVSIDEHEFVPNDTEIELLTDAWRRVVSRAERLLGSRKRVFELTPEEHASLDKLVRSDASREVVLQALANVALEPVEKRLRRAAHFAEQLAQDTGKRIAVELVHDDLRLDPRSWARFWANFMHVARNAVEHGIEMPEVRHAAGKAELGRITLRAHRDGAHIVIELEDDGAGIDWKSVGARLTKRGRRASSLDALSDGVYAFSPLWAVVRDLCGLIEVRSESGRGTLVRMTFPATVSERRARSRRSFPSIRTF